MYFGDGVGGVCNARAAEENEQIVAVDTLTQCIEAASRSGWRRVSEGNKRPKENRR